MFSQGRSLMASSNLAMLAIESLMSGLAQTSHDRADRDKAYGFVQTLVLGSRVTADEQAARDLIGAFSDGAARALAANRAAAISAFIFAAVTLVMSYRVEA